MGLLALAVPAAAAAAGFLAASLWGGARQRQHQRRQRSAAAARSDWRAEGDLHFAEGTKGTSLNLASLTAADPPAFYLQPGTRRLPDCSATVGGVLLSLDSKPLASESAILRDIFEAWEAGKLASGSVRQPPLRACASEARAMAWPPCLLVFRAWPHCPWARPLPARLQCNQPQSLLPPLFPLPDAGWCGPLANVRWQHVAGDGVPAAAGLPPSQRGSPSQPCCPGGGRPPASSGQARPLSGHAPSAASHRCLPARRGQR